MLQVVTNNIPIGHKINFMLLLMQLLIIKRQESLKNCHKENTLAGVYKTKKYNLHL